MKAWELMSPYKGAAVVLDPRNGEILAMVSTPSFDPNNDSLEKTGTSCGKTVGIHCLIGLLRDYIPQDPL